MQVKTPYLTFSILMLIVISCVFAGWITPHDPEYMNLTEIGKAPGGTHFFGTDTLGRDLFAGVLYGGRVSLFIGSMAALIGTAIAILYGCASGLASGRIDDVLMRFTEILMSIPQILFVIFIQAVIGEANAFSISAAIGITGWMAVAKMVRSEVKQLRGADYVLAAKTMGGGFLYTLWNHLMPNFMPSIMFMIVTNLGSAIAMEATLSFLGIGLPVHVISWGSLMAMSQDALMAEYWWLPVIPGVFLIVTLACITNLGEFARLRGSREILI